MKIINNIIIQPEGTQRNGNSLWNKTGSQAKQRTHIKRKYL